MINGLPLSRVEEELRKVDAALNAIDSQAGDNIKKQDRINAISESQGQAEKEVKDLEEERAEKEGFADATRKDIRNIDSELIRLKAEVGNLRLVDIKELERRVNDIEGRLSVELE